MHIAPAKKIPLLSYPTLDDVLVSVKKILLRFSHSPVISVYYLYIVELVLVLNMYEILVTGGLERK